MAEKMSQDRIDRFGDDCYRVVKPAPKRGGKPEPKKQQGKNRK